MRSDTGGVKRWPPGWLVPLTGMLGLVLGLCSAAFAAEEGKQYLGKVVYEKTILGKAYRIEMIEDEAGSYRVYWGDEELKWEPKPWYDDELKAKGPLLYTEWLQPLYYPYTIPLEEREKFDAFEVQNTGTFLGPFSAPSFEDKFEAHLYAPGAEYRRDKTGFEWNKWYATAANGKWRWDPSPPPELEGQPYRKYVFLFRSPRDLLKVGFLQIQYQGKNKEDDNFLYLPTVRKVRRLATANRQDVIGGLIIRQEQNALMTPIHHYKMLRTELFNPPPDRFSFGAGGELNQNPDENFKRLDGIGEPCWVYETTPFREDWWFARQINYVGIFTLTNWHVESYDREGRLVQLMGWPQVLSPPGEASTDGVLNCCGRKTHLAWGPAPFKDTTTGFWAFGYPSERTLNPPIPDEFYNVQTLIKEPKTIDFYR